MAKPSAKKHYTFLRLLIALAICKLEKDGQYTTGKDIADTVFKYTDDHPSLYRGIYVTLASMREYGQVEAYYHDDLPRRRCVWKLTRKGAKVLDQSLYQIDQLRTATKKLLKLVQEAAA